MFPPVLGCIFPTVLLHVVFILKEAVRTVAGPAAGPKQADRSDAEAVVFLSTNRAKTRAVDHAFSNRTYI